MWNPPIALTLEEQPRAARTRKARTCFVLRRERCPARLDTALQRTLAQRSRPTSTGKAPVAVGLGALALRLQASGHGGDREAVELTSMDTRGQRVLDGLGTAQPPCSQGTRCHVRLRRMAPNLDKTRLDRTVPLAAPPGGFGARPVRAALEATPRCGARRVEAPLHWLGHALCKAVGLGAQARGLATDVLGEEGGLTLGGRSRLQAALALRWGEPGAPAMARRVVVEAVDRWQRGLAQPPALVAPASPLQEVRGPLGQRVEPETAPDPEGRPGERRLNTPGAPERRIARADQDRRHGRTRRSNTCKGCKEPMVLDRESHVTRAVVVRPAHAPA